MKNLILFSLLILLSYTEISALDLQVGDVKDNRSTGQFFRNLEIELKILGDELNNASAIKTNITSAIDSTGKDLVIKDEWGDGFQELSRFGGNVNNTFSLRFANPARSADSLKEVTGEIILYVPKNDPNCLLTLNGLDSFTAKPISSNILKSAKIDLSFYTNEQYNVLIEKEQKEKIAKMKSEGASEQMIQFANQFSNSMGDGAENQLILKLSDPEKRLIGFNFYSANGDKIENNGTMTSNGTKHIYFNQKMPTDAKLEVQVLTDKSVIKLPINLQGIKLP